MFTSMPMMQSLSGFSYNDKGGDYIDIQPTDIDEKDLHDHPIYRQLKTSDPNLPTKLVSPLIQIPDLLHEYFSVPVVKYTNDLNPELKDACCETKTLVTKLMVTYDLTYTKDFCNSVMRFKDYKFVADTDTMTKEMISISIRMAKQEINFVGGTKFNLDEEYVHNVPVNSSIVFIQRIRSLWSLGDHNIIDPSLELTHQTYNGEVYQIGRSTRFVYDRKSDDGFIIIENGRFCIFCDLKRNIITVGGTEHGNYFYTYIETICNMQIMRNCDCYSDFHIMFDYLMNMPDIFCDYTICVDISKQLETLLLMRVDTEDENKVVWFPVFMAVCDFYITFTKITPDNDLLYKLMCIYLYGSKENYPLNSCEYILNIISQYKGIRALELSSIHKCWYYSEVNEEKGILKYKKRTCTRRVVDKLYVYKLLYSFRRMFIYGFMKKHNVLPNLSTNVEKRSKLEEILLQRNPSLILAERLDFFEDIQLKKCIDSDVPTDILYYCKDKSATRDDAEFNNTSTINEIKATITHKGNILDCSVKDVDNVTEEPAYFVSEIGSYKSSKQNKVKLAMKEKEQKSEGRLFGIGTLEKKVSLSIITEQVKKVLTYIHGNLMTPSNSERSAMLHELAQKMLDDNYWSFLADIEGHNQSIQPDNSDIISKEVSAVLGLDSLQNLSQILRDLTVFYPMKYVNKVHIIKNQHGGIEGWMNPFWTIITCVLFDSARDDSPVKIDEILVYSDDVDMGCRIDEFNEVKIKQFFDYIVNHAGRCGFTLKLSQTILTPKRSTMLRRHHTNGQPADSSVKRALSMSSMSESSFHNDSVEVAGTCSACTSALDNANNLYSSLIMKHFHIISTCHRSFCDLFLNLRHDSSIPVEHLSSVIQSLTIDSTMEAYTNNYTALRFNIDAKIKGLASRLGLHKPEERKGYIEGYLRDKVTTIINADKKINYMWIILRELSLNNVMNFLYQCLIYLPESMGGLAAIPLLYQSLTGHSISSSRCLDYIIMSARKNNIPTKLRDEILNNMYGVNSETVGRMGDESVLTSAYPSCKGIRTINSAIENKIINYIRNLDLNNEFKNKLKSYDLKDEIYAKILTLFKDRLHYRITSMFIEHSPIKLIKSLLSKVETSRGFFRSSGKMANFRKLVMRLNRDNYLRLFTRCDHNIIKHRSVGDATTFLEFRNKQLFKDINFITMPEPTIESSLEWDTKHPAEVIACKCSRFKTSKNRTVYKLPDVEGVSAYAGEREKRYLQFSNQEARLIYDLSNLVKWILIVSGKNCKNEQSLRKTNLYLAYKYILNCFSIKNHFDILSCAISAVTGNVAHRLTGHAFQSKVSLHILPLIINGISSNIVQDWISYNNLGESNMNMELVVKRIKLAYAMRILYQPEGTEFLKVRFFSLINYHDVRIDWSMQYEDDIKLDVSKPYIYALDRLDILRMRLISNISTIDDVDSNRVMITDDMLRNHRSVSLKDHRELKAFEYRERLLLEGICNYDDIYDRSYWEPFLEIGIQHKDKGTKELMDSEFKSLTDKLKSQRNISDLYVDKLKCRSIYDNIGKAFLTLLSSQDHTFRLFLTNWQKVNLDRDPLKNTLDLMTSLMLSVERSGDCGDMTGFLKENLLILMICTDFKMFSLLGNKVTINEDTLRRSVINCLDFDFKVTERFTRYGYCSYLLNTIYTKNSLNYYLTETVSLLNRISPEISLAHLSEFNELKFSIPIVDSNINTENLIHDYSYSLTLIEDPDELDAKLYRELQFKAEYTSSLYSDILAFTSPTQSESYSAQLGVITSIIKVIKEDINIKVIDVCSGRGDGNIAFGSLGLNVTSLARKDLYSILDNNKSVNIVKNYDLFNDDFSSLLVGYNWIHIDISVNKGDYTSLVRILNGIKRCLKILTIRLNCIYYNDYKLLIDNFDDDYFKFISHPSHDKISPPQIYLVVIKVDAFKEFYSVKSVWKNNGLYRTMMSSYNRVMSYKNMVTPGVDELHNTAMSFFRGLPSLKDVCKGSINFKNLLLDMDEMKPLMNSYESSSIILSNDSIEEYLKVDPLEGCYLDDSEQKLIHDSMKAIDSSYETKSKQKDKWLELKEELFRSEEPVKFVKMEYLTWDQIKAVKYRHPVYTCRRIAIAYLIMRENFEDLDVCDVRSTVEEMMSSDNAKLPDSNSRITCMNTALTHLAFTKLNGEPNIGLKLLVLRLMMNKRKIGHSLKTIRYYRQLMPLMSKWDQENVAWPDQSEFVENFENSYSESLINLNLQRISNIKDNMSKSPDDAFQELDTIGQSILDFLMGKEGGEMFTGMVGDVRESLFGDVESVEESGLDTLGGMLDVTDDMFEEVGNIFFDMMDLPDAATLMAMRNPKYPLP